VYFRLCKDEFGEMAYEKLCSDETLQAELPNGIEWTQKDGIHTLIASMSMADVHPVEHRQAIQSFFSETINIFINAFRKRMAVISKELNA